jgi:hypothetical protein
MIYVTIRLRQNLKDLLDTIIFVELHVVQTGFGAHPASYPIGTGGYFPGSKATEA